VAFGHVLMGMVFAVTDVESVLLGLLLVVVVVVVVVVLVQDSTVLLGQ